jgi:hypothetical protein
MSESAKWQQYKHAVAALIVIIVFCGFLFSYIAVVISASSPATKALNNIDITISQTNPPAAIIDGNLVNFAQGYLNVTNTGDKNVTVTLIMSATVYVWDGYKNIYYNLGSMTIPDSIIGADSTKIIQATINGTEGIFPEFGAWSYYCSVQASITLNYLFLHPEVANKTIEFNGTASILTAQKM